MARVLVLSLLLALPLAAGAAAPARLLDVTLAPPEALGLQPFEPLDDGGGARGVKSPHLAAFAAFLVGFGAGHAMVSATDAALLWLPLDAGVVIVVITAGALTGSGWVWLVGLAGLLTERAFQAVSAFSAGKLFDPADDGNNRFDDESEQNKRLRDEERIDDARAPTLQPALVPAFVLRGTF